MKKGCIKVMGLRKYKRSIAKAVLTDAGVGNVNRKMSKERDGVKLWRLALKEHAKVCRKVKPSRKTIRTIRKAAKA